MNCFKKDECINYKTRCFECQSMADMMSPYPNYTDKKEQEKKLNRILADIPALLSRAENSPYDKKRLVRYLINNGVRVEE